MKSTKPMHTLLRKSGFLVNYLKKSILSFGILILAAAVNPAMAVDYFTFQSGDWSTFTTWTTDPTGLTQSGTGIPGAGDQIFLINTRDVTTTLDRTVNAVVVNTGSSLNLGSSTGHNLGTVSGTGRIIIQSTTFPLGNFSSFVSSAGGTIEYLNVSGVLPNQLVYNNLIISNNTGAPVSTTFPNPANPTTYTINGNFDLDVSGGAALNFLLGNTPGNVINFNVSGNVVVDGLGTFGVGNFNTIHNVNVDGNFTNSGVIQFSNTAQFVPATNGAANLTFSGNVPSFFFCGGATNLYTLVINKGVDFTIPVNLSAGAVNNFRLFSDGDALQLLNGTLSVGNNISINRVNAGGIFTIPETFSLDVDNGGFVPDGQIGGLLIRGRLRVVSGTMTIGNEGLVLGPTGSILVNGGTSLVEKIRPEFVAANHIGSFTQTGGVLTVNGLTGGTATGETPRFCLPYPNQGFYMSGGTLNVANPETGTAVNGGILIGVSPSFFGVTGGTVNVTIPASSVDFNINSTAPFFNMNISKAGAGTAKLTLATQVTGSSLNQVYFSSPIAPQALTIANSLALVTGNNPELFANGTNVLVRRNFVIDVGTTYTPGTNTTTFNGTTSQTCTINGTLTDGFYRLTIAKPLNQTAFFAGTISVVTIRDLLTVTVGSLNDGGKTISCLGDILSNGVCTGPGRFMLTGTGTQTISSPTTATSRFGNLILNKATGVVVANSVIQISSSLRLANTAAVLDIGNNELLINVNARIFDDVTGSGTSNFGPNRMVRCNGLFSSAGINKRYNATNTSFLYPIGTGSDYAPATISLVGSPTAYGFIAIRPVDEEHPIVTASPAAIQYYWRTTSTGFNLGTANVLHTYTYPDASIVLAGSTEADYVPGRFDIDNIVWQSGTSADVNEATNTATFSPSVFGQILDGEYTVGANNVSNPFLGLVAFYSTGDGLWEDNNINSTIWSVIGHGGQPTVALPNTNSPVFIGDGVNFFHRVVMSANGNKCGNLSIGLGSTLDLGITRGHSMAVLTGTQASGRGRIRISSDLPLAEFPTGDFGTFLGPNGGQIEYYTTGISFSIPTVSVPPLPIPLTNYYDLIVSPEGGQSITMPDLNLVVLNEFIVEGGAFPNGVVRLNSVSPRTLTVNVRLRCNSGELQFRNGQAQTLISVGNAFVEEQGLITVAGTGAIVNNLIRFGANLTVEGVIDFIESGRVVNTEFTGPSLRTLGGLVTTSTIEFNKLRIDKGVTMSTFLDITYRGTLTAPSDNWLELINGGLRLSWPISLTLTSSATPFILNNTCQLILNHPGAAVNIGLFNSDDADLILNGHLILINGSVNIGSPGLASNNDIEYSPVGNPRISLSNTSSLYVNGQIRRNNSNLNGALDFRLTGNSTTLIAGANANVNRGKLEVLNIGSNFEFSNNADLRFLRGGGTSFSDLYLDPTTATVTGGLVRVQTSNNNGDQVFSISSSTPLFNIAVTGFDANDKATIRLVNFPLTVNGSLTISNDNSIFNANGKDLILSGNLSNQNTNSASGITVGGFQSGTSTQKTIFQGSTAQTLTGVGSNRTNFANLEVAGTGAGSVTLQPNTAVTVHTKLSILSGTLNDGGNTITVLGNIENDGVHTSSGSGSILLQGTSPQVIDGNGSGNFGRLRLDNTLGAFTDAGIAVNNELALVTGTLMIKFHGLTLSQNATVTGTFSSSRMIRTNGDFSDSGVVKLFNAGASNFTFPIGAGFSYTPATYTIAANTAPGSIRVIPIGFKHPSTTDAANRELTYHWKVNQTGFAGLNVTHQYNYLDAFVNGNENNYVTGRYLGFQWTPTFGIPATVDPTLNRMTLTGVNYIQGEYTAGEPSEFDLIDTLYSANATLGGNWDNPNTWSVGGHNGPPAGVIPTFQILFVAPGHTINTNGNNRSCSFMNLDGTLDCAGDVGTLLGALQGTGRLKISSGATNQYTFPIGNILSFNGPSGGIVEYYGSTNGFIQSVPPTNFYHNIEFSGSGNKEMPNNPFVVFNDWTMGGTGVIDNSVFGTDLEVRGNWINNGSSGSYLGGNGSVVLGGVNQFIGGTANTQFGSLILDGSGTKTLNRSIRIDNQLTIDNGVSLDVSASNFGIDIRGNWENNGTFIPQNGTVNFNGLIGNQQISGTAVSRFYTLSSNNIFGVTLNQNIEVANALNVNTGTFDSNGKITRLLSNLTRTGRIAPLLTGDYIGKITQDRLAPGPLTGWALLGAPVQGALINQWTDDFPTSGFVGSTGSVGTFISIYSYDETDLGDFTSVGSYNPVINSSVDQITPGTGFWVYLGTGFTNTADILIDVTGDIVKGSFDFGPTYTTSGQPVVDGFNLVSNPYPSAIDWDNANWTKSNMDDAVYIYQADLGQYATYIDGIGVNGGSRFLPSTQGFYVKANGSNPILQSVEQVKSSQNPTFLRTIPSEQSAGVLKIKLSGNGYSDESVVRFHPDATIGYDQSKDGYKLVNTMNSTPTLSTISEGTEFSVNTLPTNQDEFVIPIRVKVGESGNYALTFSGVEALGDISCMVLEDRVENTSTPVQSLKSYSFTMDPYYDEIRFLLHVAKPRSVSAEPASCSNTSDGLIQIGSSDDGMQRAYKIMDGNNQVIAAGIAGAEGASISNVKPGTYQLVFSGYACGEMSSTVTVASTRSVSSEIFINGVSDVASVEGVSEYSTKEQADRYVWDFSDGTQLEGMAVKHAFAEAGDHRVTLSCYNDGCVASETKLISAIRENGSESLDFVVLRNEGGLFIEFNQAVNGQINIEVMNGLGQLAMPALNGQANSNRYFLPMSELASGVYMIRVQNDSGSSTRKINW